MSPEELAAIEHGIASVYGKLPEADLAAGFVPDRFGTVLDNTNPKNDYQTPLPQRSTQKTPFHDKENNQSTPFNNTFAGKENNFAAASPKILDEFLSPPGTAPQADKLLQQERQRYATMEQHYRRELERLKRNNLEYSERLRLEQTIQELRKRIGDLEAQLKQARRTSADDRLAAMQLHYDRKIAALTRQFEQEKQSHAEIMRARMKSEINLLVPKIRAQCQAALERSNSDTVSKLKSQASSYISKLKQDFELEKQVLKEHLKRRFDQELRSMSAQMQQKFEFKLAQERNALERKYLDRTQQRPVNTFNFEPSFLL